MEIKFTLLFAIFFSLLIATIQNAQQTSAIALALPVAPPPQQTGTLTGCGTGGGINSAVTQLVPWYCTSVNPAIAAVWAKWLPVMLIMITVVFSIAIVIFIFGVALRNERLRQFGVGELYEAMATTLIVGLFMFVAAVMFGILPAITAGPINPYDTALSYIATTINTTQVSAGGLFNVIALSQFYASIQFKVTGLDELSTPPILPVYAFGLTYFFFWPAWSIVSFMVEALMSLYTQFYLILFLMYAAIPVFLIPGILFRALIPTRALGGMMIATAIGFYFVMPTLFSVAYYFTSNSIASQLAGGNSVVSRYTNGGTSLISNGDSQGAPLSVALTQMQSSFSSYWLSILFFPVLIIAITYSLITQIAELIGGASKTSSRLRSLV